MAAEQPASETPVVETLAAPPHLAAVFARAALTSRGRGGDLPERSLRLEGQVVDRSHLVRYQRVCGFPAGDVLPHTYPHVLGFPLQAELMARRDFPLPLSGLVHLQNTITVLRRLTADDSLDLEVHAEGLRPHPKGTLVDLVTEAAVGGEAVWRGRSTYLRRARPGADAAPRAADAGQAAAGAGQEAAAPAMPQGEPAAVWRLPEGLGRTYAAASGDVNPIHLHALTAKALGFPQAIAHGMWTYARTLAALGPRAQGPSTSHVWFRSPVLLPGAVALVVSRSGSSVTAGLRAPKEGGREHLVLTLA